MRGASALAALAATAILGGCPGASRALDAGDAAGVPATASTEEPPPAITRLAVVQGASSVSIAFRDGANTDLRAPGRSTVGERARTGAGIGAFPGAVLMQGGGASPGMAAAGVMLALVGGAVGAVTGAIVGGVQDAVNESNVPREKITLYAPVLESAAGDLVQGPRPLHECVAAELGTTPTDGANAPDPAALAEQGYSHMLTLDSVELGFVQAATEGPDRREGFAAKTVVRYSVHQLGAEPRLLSTGRASHDAPAQPLDRWAAERGREVRELAARGCPLLAAKLGADLAGRYALAPR